MKSRTQHLPYFSNPLGHYALVTLSPLPRDLEEMPSSTPYFHSKQKAVGIISIDADILCIYTWHSQECLYLSSSQWSKTRPFVRTPQLRHVHCPASQHLHCNSITHPPQLRRHDTMPPSARKTDSTTRNEVKLVENLMKRRRSNEWIELTLSHKLTCALCFSNASTTSTWPKPAAHNNAVFPPYQAIIAQHKLYLNLSLRSSKTRYEVRLQYVTYCVLQIYLRIVFQQRINHRDVTMTRCAHQCRVSALKNEN